MIFKALIVLEIVAASVLGGWLILFQNPTEPPKAPDLAPQTTQVAIPIVIPTQSPPQPQVLAVQTENTPIPTTEPTPTPAPNSPPPQTIYIPIYITQPTPEPTPLPTQPQQSMSSIEIISPVGSKGIVAGRTYTAQPEVIDETNYVYLGLIVLDDAGNPDKNVEVTITATDETQNKTLNGTGNVYPRYENEVRIITPFYPFHYEFHTVGDHTITFSANDMTKSVTFTVVAPDPA